MITRIHKGRPDGGQFAAHSRSDDTVSLDAHLPAREEDVLRDLPDLHRKMMQRSLDRARNGFGEPLAAEQRANIVAVIDSPDEQSWHNARSAIIAEEGLTTLWQAVLAHTDFRDDAPASALTDHWGHAPTRGQILVALDKGTRA